MDTPSSFSVVIRPVSDAARKINEQHPARRRRFGTAVGVALDDEGQFRSRMDAGPVALMPNVRSIQRCICFDTSGDFPATPDDTSQNLEREAHHEGTSRSFKSFCEAKTLASQ